MSAPQPSKSNWYPTITQLGTPEQMHATLKQVLDQHYALQDQVNRFYAESRAGANRTPDTGKTPPGSGPTDTQILGLYVKPVSPQALANGAKLTWVAADGNFQFI